MNLSLSSSLWLVSEKRTPTKSNARHGPCCCPSLHPHLLPLVLPLVIQLRVKIPIPLAIQLVLIILFALLEWKLPQPLPVPAAPVNKFNWSQWRGRVAPEKISALYCFASTLMASASPSLPTTASAPPTPSPPSPSLSTPASSPPTKSSRPTPFLTWVRLTPARNLNPLHPHSLAQWRGPTSSSSRYHFLPSPSPPSSLAPAPTPKTPWWATSSTLTSRSPRWLLSSRLTLSPSSPPNLRERSLPAAGSKGKICWLSRRLLLAHGGITKEASHCSTQPLDCRRRAAARFKLR